DGAGRLRWRTDEEGRRTEYERDCQNLRAVTLPDGTQAQYSWNADGRLASYTNALGESVTYAYQQGLLRSIRLPSGATQAFEYAEGRLVRETDADGRSVQHEYDAAGRRSASLYAGGERVARMFTAAGEPYEVSDAR